MIDHSSINGLTAVELLQNVFAAKQAIDEVHGRPGPEDILNEIAACESRLDELLGEDRTIEVRLAPEERTHWREMRIVAAAVMFDQWIYTMPPPARHYNIVHLMDAKLGIRQDHRSEQGFMTDTGHFMRRKPAMMIAENAGQLLKPIPSNRSNDLFSEDLW